MGPFIIASEIIMNTEPIEKSALNLLGMITISGKNVNETIKKQSPMPKNIEKFFQFVAAFCTSCIYPVRFERDVVELYTPFIILPFNLPKVFEIRPESSA